MFTAPTPEIHDYTFKLLEAKIKTKQLPIVKEALDQITDKMWDLNHGTHDTIEKTINTWSDYWIEYRYKTVIK